MKLINLANTAQQFPRDAPLNCFPSASDYENSRRLCFFIPAQADAGGYGISDAVEKLPASRV